MAQPWFVTLDGAEQGPFDQGQLKRLAAQGRIGPETPVRRGDLAQAVAARAVKGLLPAAPAALPPRPDTTEPDQARPEAEAEDPFGDEDDADPDSELRTGFGRRLAAFAIDCGVMGLQGGIGLVVGLMLMLGNPTGTLDGIDRRRADLDARSAFPVPSMMQYRSDRALGTGMPPPTTMDPADIEAEVDATMAETDWSKHSADAVRDYRASVLQTVEANRRRQLATWNEHQAMLEAMYDEDLQRLHDAISQRSMIGLVILLVSLLVGWLYQPLGEGLRGRTLGKRLMGLMVIDGDWYRCTLGRALLRQLLRTVIPCGQFAALGASRQALHDSLSGSQVVDVLDYEAEVAKRKATRTRSRRRR